MNKKCVIKRHGKEELYDERKVYASIYAAALNCEYGEKKSETMARSVAKKITAWINSKKCVDSKSIKKKVTKLLDDKNVLLMYESHLDIS